MTCNIVVLGTGIPPFILPCICSFFLSFHIFVKDISATLYDRKFIFGIQNNNDKFYRGIGNQLCPVCSSLYLFSFLSLCNQYCNFS